LAGANFFKSPLPFNKLKMMGSSKLTNNRQIKLLIAGDELGRLNF